MFGMEIDSAGEYYFTLPSTTSQCDTQIVVIVEHRNAIELQTERIVCKDEGVEFLGEMYFSGGPYETKIIAEGGCDTLWELIVYEENYDSLRVVGPNRLCTDEAELKVTGVSSSDINSSSWNTGNTGLQTKIVDPGIYTWEGESERGCVYRVEKEIEECTTCQIAIPNTFTPNGDDINDVFRVSSSCDLIGFKAEIFDRWGKLVVVSRDPKVIWDGRDYHSGTYVYRINYRVETVQGLIEKTKYGTLALLL